MLAQIIYLIPVILSIIALWVLLSRHEGVKSGYFVALFITILVTSFGIYLAGTATTVDMALFGTQISYLNGTFAVYFSMCCMMYICGIKIKPWFSIPLVLIDFEIIVVVFLARFNKWHYKSYDIAFDNGFTYLIKEYGPHHTFYFVALVANLTIPFIIVIYSFIRKKQVSWIYALLMGVSEIVFLLVYVIERIAGIHIELTPYSYVVGEAIYLIILRRIEMYDVAGSVSVQAARSFDHGYVMFNPDLKFLGCDEAAKAFFPELNDLALDREVNNRFLREEFGEWAFESFRHHVEPKYFERNGKDIKVTAEPFYSEAGTKFYGYMLSISDDTVNQNYIKELKKANILAQEYAKKAEAANKSKSEFLSNMSHEIRTPINAVLGLNEMVLRESSEEAIRSYAFDIKSSGNTLLSLVNDLLDFSKIEAGKMELVKSDYDLSILLNDVVNMIGVRASNKGLDFKLNIDANTPRHLFGDEVRVKQIIVNILTNAVKYTEKGKVTLNLGFEKRSEKVVLLKVSVEDTGIGMKPETIEHLFTPYERIDEVRNKHIEGTGLGMSITQKFLEMMDSKLNVESKYGEGSKFFFEVLTEITDEEPIGNFAEAVKKIKENAKTYKAQFTAPKANVLVVDDTLINIKVFRGLLKQTKIQIDEAHSGFDAIHMCCNKKYDAIFLDHMMPGLDGIETLQRLKEMPDNMNEGVPVIAMTANATQNAKDDYFSKGFADYVTKPIDPISLETSLMRLLSKDKVIKT